MQLKKRGSHLGEWRTFQYIVGYYSSKKIDDEKLTVAEDYAVLSDCEIYATSSNCVSLLGKAFLSIDKSLMIRTSSLVVRVVF